MAGQGWDSLTIDLQHGLIDYQAAVGILQAISGGRATALVRIPWLDPAIIMKASEILRGMERSPESAVL